MRFLSPAASTQRRAVAGDASLSFGVTCLPSAGQRRFRLRPTSQRRLWGPPAASDCAVPPATCGPGGLGEGQSPVAVAAAAMTCRAPAGPCPLCLCSCPGHRTECSRRVSGAAAPWPRCGRTDGGRRVSSHRPALVAPRQVEPHCATGVKGQASVSAACPGRAADRDAPPAGDEGAECGAVPDQASICPRSPGAAGKSLAQIRHPRAAKSPVNII